MLLDWVTAHAVRLASSAHSRVASTTERLIGARPPCAPMSTKSEREGGVSGRVVHRRFLHVLSDASLRGFLCVRFPCPCSGGAGKGIGRKKNVLLRGKSSPVGTFATASRDVSEEDQEAGGQAQHRKKEPADLL